MAKTATKARTFPAYDLKGGDFIMVDGKLVEVYDTTITGSRSQYVNVRYIDHNGQVQDMRTGAYGDVRVY